MIYLLMMTFVLIKGIENAELKNKLSGSVLRDDLDGKTKAWLLMVESGKADEDHVRKITPKSIFIAPLLSSRSNKCKEGYRHDHLGQCVKVIKLDQRVELEKLLKRLSAMYTENKSDQDGLPHISNGPLQFSLPISGVNGTSKEDVDQEVDTSTVTEVTTTMLPTGRNETDDVNFPETLSESDVYEGSGLEGSGFEETTEYSTLAPDDPEYTQTTETSTATVPYATDSYESVTFPISNPEGFFPLRKINPNPTPATVQRPTTIRVERPDRIVFPDELTGASSRRGEVKHTPQVHDYHVWSTDYQYDVRKLPTQQLWWLPHNWRVDEEQRKPAVFKFWSHLPLVHDPSLIEQEKPKRPYAQTQPIAGQFHPSARIPEGLSIELQQPLATHRRGRLNRGRGRDDYGRPTAFVQVM